MIYLDLHLCPQQFDDERTDNKHNGLDNRMSSSGKQKQANKEEGQRSLFLFTWRRHSFYCRNLCVFLVFSFIVVNWTVRFLSSFS